MCIALLLSACSSAPKNPGEVHDMRRRSESQLEQGNQQAGRGSFDAALVFLNEALRLAVATDDSSLRIRAGLSRGNVLFSLGRGDEAAADWNHALNEAVQTGNRELEALCRLHSARGRLLTTGSSAAQSVRDEVHRELAFIRSDQLSIAFAWTLAALAEKELGNFAAAEAASRRSLGIHERERNFEFAAYDWFLIASFRSLSGDFNSARQALEAAITFDRRVENSWGLANDWRALGDVERRAGSHDAARRAYLRSAEIFRAIGMDEAAEEALARSE